MWWWVERSVACSRQIRDISEAIPHNTTLILAGYLLYTDGYMHAADFLIYWTKKQAKKKKASWSQRGSNLACLSGLPFPNSVNSAHQLKEAKRYKTRTPKSSERRVIILLLHSFAFTPWEITATPNGPAS